jgi:hypothetical protein
MRKLWHFKNYTSKAGKPAASIELHITDMPTMQTDFPIDVRGEALRQSARLGDVLNELAEVQRLKRDLVVGPRLDPRKRHNVGVAMRKGELDVFQMRPYQKRTLTLDLPTICVVGSAGVTEVNSDSNYVTRITQLCCAIGWACEALGVECRSVLMEGVLSDQLRGVIKEVQLAYTLLEPGKFTNLQAYSVATNRNEFYSVGFAGAWERDADARSQIRAIQNIQVKWSNALLSDHAGNGVHWARSLYAPDIVIAVGNVQDAKDAEIRLDNTFTLDQAITSIIAQVRELRLRGDQ